MAPPCTYVRCFNMDKQGGVIKVTELSPARLGVNAKCFAGYKGGVISTCNATGITRPAARLPPS